MSGSASPLSEKLSESRKNKDATAEWGGTAGHVEGDKWVVEKIIGKRRRKTAHATHVARPPPPQLALAQA